MGSALSKSPNQSGRGSLFSFISNHPFVTSGSVIGIGVAASHCKYLEAVDALGNVANVRSPSKIFYLRLLFGKQRSRFTGKLLEQTIPVWVRKPLYEYTCYWLGIDLTEIRYPLESYRSFSDFFCRSLVEGARPIVDFSPSSLLSPCDGRVTAMGDVPALLEPLEQHSSSQFSYEALLRNSRQHSREEDVRLPQLSVKGTTYSMRHFLGEDPRKKAKTQLKYCVLYLAPKDYHQFHSPCEFEITHTRHFPGDLLPVNSTFLTRFNDVFAINERVLIGGNWAGGKMWYTAVGAYNVGNIRLAFDKRIKTNEARSHQAYLGGDLSTINYDEALRLSRGDKLGEFRLGSSIVLIFEVPVGWSFSVVEGDMVKLNSRLGAVMY